VDVLCGRARGLRGVSPDLTIAFAGRVPACYSRAVYDHPDAGGTMRHLRFLYLASLTALVALLATSTVDVIASETQSAEDRAYVVQRAKTAPIVDGVVDDPAWRDVDRQQLDRDMRSGAAWANTMDFSGEFRAVWRDGSVYVAIEFDDDSVVQDRDFVERSDRVIVGIGDIYADEHREYTVPIFEGQSVEDAAIPFVAWSYDGRICELSLDTDAMADRDRRELLINLSYVDVDLTGPDQEAGWVANGPTRSQPEYGTFRFQRGVSSDGLLETSWGRMKTLY
jgi:hypothetical protein